MIRILPLALFFISSIVRAGDQESETLQRAGGGYSATIEVSLGDSHTISSILIKHGEKTFALPKDLYADIRDPHLGEGFDTESFRLEIKDSAVFIRIKSGSLKLPSDHAWIMQLPLETVRRITREAKVTGYREAHPSTPLESITQRAEQDGADQPATAPESKPEGEQKPKPEEEGRSQ